MDVYCPPVTDVEWHEREESVAEWRSEPIDAQVTADWELYFSETPYEGKVQAEYHLDHSKLRGLVLSCILASSLALVSLVFGLGDVLGLFRVVHPFFWFPIAAGACGVGGSNFIYLRRLWP